MINFMKAFEFAGLPWNVIFGAGALARLPQILDRQGLRRALVLSTPGGQRHADKVKSAAGGSVAAGFAGAAVHVPAGVVTEAARVARESGADCTISIGGGSTTGLGKRLRLEIGLPQIAIPTTYAGSEMTPIWGVTEGGVKQTGRDPRALPVAVIYDPELLVSLPPRVAGPSAMNAMAQAIANIATNPPVGMLAREAIRVLARGLPRVMDHIDNVEAQAEMLLGACLAGAALGLGRSGLHHRICHLLGGMYNLPHAELHAVILPYSVAYIERTAPEQASLIAEALETSDAAAHVYGMMRRFTTKHSLEDLGLSATDMDQAAALVTAAAADGGKEITEAAIRDLLASAHQGSAP